MNERANPFTRPAHPASVRLEDVLERFEEAWQGGQPPPLDRFLPDNVLERAAVLRELVHTDLEYRLKGGLDARVETYLLSYPELANDRTVMLELIGAEFALRQSEPVQPCLSEYVQRFPEYADDLAVHLQTTQPQPAAMPRPMHCPHCGSSLSQGTDREAAHVLCTSCGTLVRFEPETSAAGAPAAGTRLGKYLLQEVVGRGAFGVVYRARDTELDRTVAVKLPRLGNLMEPEERDRFLREARSAAQLRHPHIVALHDTGEWEGMCYLVSEFVEGVTLAERLAAGAFRFRHTAELLAQVAEALHCAHQHGVVHRDLKPGNILLDPAGQPHVMDFGLAKRDTGEVRLTQAGQVLGTPAYLSPEQARGESDQVDARGDIWSLGVILYEMLTGELPFRGTMRMILWQVAEEMPRPPRRLNDRIPRDLETICLKCLEKEPPRRYASAAALAADLRRFVAGEPIQARPVSRPERLWRWCRRKPLVAGLTAALLLAVVLGFAGVTGQWRRAERLRTQAEQHAEDLARERDRAVNAEKRAERRFQEVRQLARAFMFDFDERIEKLADAMPARKFLVEQALAYLEKLAPEAGDDPSLLRDLAQGYRQVGDIQGHPHMANLGDTPGALASYRKSLEFAEKVARLQPDDPGAQRSLFIACMEISDLQWVLGKATEALAGFRKGLELAEARARAAPGDMLASHDLLVCYQRVGDMLATLGRPAEALAEYHRQLALAETLARAGIEPAKGWAQRGVCVSLHKVGDMQKALGQEKEALASYRKGLAIAMAEATADPKDAHWQRILLASRTNVGDTLTALKEDREALSHYQQALAIAERLAAADGKNAQAQRDLSCCLDRLGRVQTKLGDPQEALATHRRSLAIAQTLADADPQNTRAQRDLADGHRYLADTLAALGQEKEALSHYQNGVTLLERLVQGDSKNAQTRRALAGLCRKVGNFHADLGAKEGRPRADRQRQWQAAHPWYERARELFAGLHKDGILPPDEAGAVKQLAEAIRRCTREIERLKE